MKGLLGCSLLSLLEILHRDPLLLEIKMMLFLLTGQTKDVFNYGDEDADDGMCNTRFIYFQPGVSCVI